MYFVRLCRKLGCWHDAQPQKTKQTSKILRFFATILCDCRAGPEAIDKVLARDPALVNDVSTGGATPLHMCGMSQRAQHSAAHLLEKGADANARDTYGYTPLHRMASNNLAEGAKALIRGGANVHADAGWMGQSALDVAQSSQARAVEAVLQAALAGKDV